MAECLLIPMLLAGVQDQHRRALARERRVHLPRNSVNPFEWGNNLFRHHFRLSKELVLDICGELRQALPVCNCESALSVEQKVLTALRFYASDSYQRPGGVGGCMSQKSASNCIVGVTEAINDLLFHRWVKFLIMK